MNGALLTQTVLGFVAIVLIWHFGIVRLRRDRLRSDIRAMRDDLFDFMWQNDRSFEDEQYQRARQTLNGMLVCSNYITPLMFLSLVYHNSKHDMPSRDLSQLDPALRNKIDSTMSQAVNRLNHFLFLEGVLGAFIRCLLQAIHWASIAGKITRWAQRQGQINLPAYYAIGDPWCRRNGPSVIAR